MAGAGLYGLESQLSDLPRYMSYKVFFLASHFAILAMPAVLVFDDSEVRMF